MDKSSFNLAPFVFPGVAELSLWEIACRQSEQDSTEERPNSKTIVVLWLLIEDFQIGKLKVALKLFDGEEVVEIDQAKISAVVAYCATVEKLHQLFRKLFVKREDWIAYLDWKPKAVKLMGEA